jgi:hypothetical protein
MKTGHIIAFIALLSICSAQEITSSLGGIPLSTSLESFTARYPAARCNSIGPFRSCTVSGLGIAGVQASRTDFNFASATLASINVVFDPTPDDEQLKAIEGELTKAYGQPERREISPSHRLHAAWRNGRRRLLFNVGLDRTIIILETVQ